MPGTEWFPGATLNYAEHALTPGPGRGDDDIAAVAVVEDGTERRSPTPSCATSSPGPARAWPRPASGWATGWSRWHPNSVETLVAFLATASLGAVWSSCSPDFGPRAVLDRFAQIEPTVLVAVDGYRYNGKRFDVRETRRRPCRRRCRRCGRRCWCRTSTPTRRSTGTVAVGEAHRHRGAAGVHARPVRPPAVGALLLGDDRAAQGHRAGARRDRRRAPQGCSRSSTTSAPATASCGSPPRAG